MILHNPFRIIVRTNKITKAIFWLKNIVGIAIVPFIIIRRDDLVTNTGTWHICQNEDRLICHESIHIKQQYEMLIIFMWFWYLIEWMVRVIQYKSFHKGYQNISFEREAKQNERNINYLRTRPRYAFLRYIRTGTAG